MKMRVCFSGFFMACLALAASRASSAEPASVDPSRYLAPILEVLQAPWPGNRTINIVCHGHSVPAGYFRTPEIRSLEAYPHLLRQALARRFPHAVINVIVTAIGGENSEEGAARFRRDVLPHRPDILLIDYSLNDRKLGLKRARSAWSSMIAQSRIHGISVILLTPTPDLAADLGDPNDPLNQHAAQVRALARQSQVGLVDSLAEFTAVVARGGDLASLMAQSNHPNARGHELVAEALLKWFGN